MAGSAGAAGPSRPLAVALAAVALVAAAVAYTAPDAGQPGEAAAAWHLPAAYAQSSGGAGPSVTGVTSADGLYGVERTITITVSFDEPVVYKGGAPQLLLNMSGSPRTAAYASGSDTASLAFSYAVRAGDYAADLDYYGTAALAGDIADTSGNTANLALPAPGTGGSLAGSSDVVVDYSAPRLAAAGSAAAGFDKIAGGLWVEAFELGDDTYAAVTTYGGHMQLVRVHENGTLEAGASASDGVGGFDTLRWSYGVDVFAINYTVYALATSCQDSGVQLMRISADGTLSPLGSIVDGDSRELRCAHGIDTIDTGGGTRAAIVTGEWDSGVQLITVNYAGDMEARGSLDDDKSTLLDAPYGVAAFSLGGTPHALVAAYGDNGVQLVRINADGTLEARGSLADSASLSLARPHGVEAFDLDGRMHALVTSEAEDAVQLIRIHENGTLEGVASAVDGIGGFDELDRPYLVSVFRSVGGGTYAAVTGYRDNGVQLIHVRSDGSLFAAGSASNGDEFAELDRPHGIDTFSLGGGTYALSAEYSIDGGLQLMRLSPPASALGTDPEIVPSVARVSSPNADGAYGTGDTIAVNVSFTEPVTVTGTPLLTLETGATDRSAAYASGSGTPSLLFWYTVVEGDASDDLDYAGASALVLNGGTITSLAGSGADLTLPAPGGSASLAGTSDLAVDSVGPTVASIMSPGEASRTYYTNQQVRINVAFSEAVLVTGAPYIELNAGTDARAVYDSGSGTNTLAFVYDVRRGDDADVLDYAGSTALRLGSGGAVRDAAGNDANLALPSTDPAGSSPIAARNIAIDTGIVSVSSVTSPDADGAYAANRTISITVSFSNNVTVTGTPTLKLETGETDTDAVYSGGNSTDTLAFRYTVQPGDNTDDLDYVSGSIYLPNDSAIRQAASSVNARLSLPAPGLPESLSGSKNIVIDTAAPNVARVSSPSADGAYGTGDTIAVNVNFTEPVTVTGTPSIMLETGETDRSAAYASGSGTPSLLFTYTVKAGDDSSRLDYASASALSPGGGSIKDLAGNNADLTLPAPSSAASLAGASALAVDTKRPTVESVTSLNSTSTLYTNQRLHISVEFDEPVHVTGSPPPFIELDYSGLARAVYDSGSGTDTLRFVYDVRRGGSDIGTLGQNATLNLGGSTIRDAAGNDANRTLPDPPPEPGDLTGPVLVIKGIIINTTSIFVDRVTSPDADGARSSGAQVNITVSFSKAVSVTGGTPVLKMDTGAAGRDAVYSSGSGSADLRFEYTVQPGDNTDDLSYAGGSALLNGTAAIAAVEGGEAVRLDLPAPGLNTSLSGSKSIAIDTAAPTVARISSPNATGSYGIGDTVHVAVEFSENVTVDTSSGTPTLALETGAIDRSAVYASGSGTPSLLFTYSVAEGDASPDLDYAGASALSPNGGVIADAAGNAAHLKLPAPLGAGSLAVTSEIAVDGARAVAERPSAATASAVFAGPNTVRIDYSAPLGPAGGVDKVYGNVTIAGGDGARPTATAAVTSVSGLGTHTHIVQFGGSGAGREQGGSIEMASDLEGATGGAMYAFTDDVIPVQAGAAACTLTPAGASPVVAIERGGFVCGVDAAPGGGDARPAINVTGLLPAGGAPAQGPRMVTLPNDTVTIRASFAEVSFPPNVNATSVPADGLLELYVSAERPTAQQVADALELPAAGLEVLTVVEIGDSMTHITFDMPVRILLAGQANASAFYVNSTTGAVHPISERCAADDTAAVHAQPGRPAECWIDSGADKVIYTYHLTRFGAARAMPDAGDMCGIELVPRTVALGRVDAGASTAAQPQEIRRAGTLALESVTISAGDWLDMDDEKVLDRGATQVMPSGAGAWVPLTGEVAAAPGGDGHASARFQLVVPDGVAGSADVEITQNVMYTVTCRT